MLVTFLKNNWFKLSILVLAIVTAIQIMIAFSQLSVSVEQNQIVSTKTDNINQNMNLNLVVGSMINSRNEHLIPGIECFTNINSLMVRFASLDTFSQLYSKVVVTSTGNVYLIYAQWKNLPPNSFFAVTNTVQLTNTKTNKVTLFKNLW